MKRITQWFIAIILLGSITIQADPIITDTYVKATAYENGFPRESDDVFTEAFLCGPTSGGPYLVEIAVTDPNAPPSVEDFAPCVTEGAGTYYRRGVTYSSKYGRSRLSDGERSFTVTAQDLGFVPNPPIIQKRKDQDVHGLDSRESIKGY